MQAGNLKRPITVEVPGTTKDQYGQITATWDTLLQTWADIHTITSKEVYALGAGFNSQISHKITIRFQPAVTLAAGMRVVYLTRNFIIQAVSDPTEERRELDLLCLEQTK
ncbi:phage head closure protein [Granulicella mallensis]|uniref:Phage head-tail adaptor n=1 Tax=Granulicella mallensis (strain ATCC BAA-1857 / DSM 23137 / MP5ACTX8) TaxID=682795 RepID=G8NR98_GRAMM|nr:phage head closure protein [Granulicella mallensis]AEU36176.1 phage head-tail adaptor [Granulicella mallensis MP5ACTX8]